MYFLIIILLTLPPKRWNRSDYRQSDGAGLITASTMVDNKASAHVLEKNGFMTTSNIHKEDWGHAESTDAYRWFL